ncbi:hypothetical protein VTO42DRAFT_3336 [Malbranchea cinnamomea]
MLPNRHAGELSQLKRLRSKSEFPTLRAPEGATRPERPSTPEFNAPNAMGVGKDGWHTPKRFHEFQAQAWLITQRAKMLLTPRINRHLNVFMKAACARLITGQKAEEDLQKARELASHQMGYQMAENGCRKGGQSRCKELLMKSVIGANKISVSLNTVLQLSYG